MSLSLLVVSVEDCNKSVSFVYVHPDLTASILPTVTSTYMHRRIVVSSSYQDLAAK